MILCPQSLVPVQGQAAGCWAQTQSGKGQRSHSGQVWSVPTPEQKQQGAGQQEAMGGC